MMEKARPELPPVLDADRLRRRDEIHERLDRIYVELDRLQDAHNETEYRCGRSGHCCRVGLQLHMAECEHIARHLQRRFAERPEDRGPVIGSLLGAFEDEEWTWGTSAGRFHCAFYTTSDQGGGCSVYPDRPAVCRMYGVIMDIDDYCPRERLASGEPFLYRSPEVDRLMDAYYAALDEYGDLYPDLDYTVFMPAGVLRWLLPPEELREVRRATPKRFWRRQEGYRTQFEPIVETGGEITLPKRLKLRVP